VLTLRVGRSDAFLLGGFVICCVGFTDESLLGLDDGMLLGGNVAKDGVLVGAAVVGNTVRLAVGFGVTGAPLGALLANADGCALKLRVGRSDAFLLGGFVISRVGFTDVTSLGLEDGILLGWKVAKDGENVGNAVGKLDL